MSFRMTVKDIEIETTGFFRLLKTDGPGYAERSPAPMGEAVMGPDAPLFNGTGAVPVMEAQA